MSTRDEPVQSESDDDFFGARQQNSNRRSVCFVLNFWLVVLVQTVLLTLP